MRQIRRAALAGLLITGGTFTAMDSALAANACPLSQPSSTIKHIVFLQFDNLHLERDEPNVPSDLEQMPNLLNFMKNEGVLSGNDHTVQISHTANGFLTTQTGVYSDRLGTAVSNSFLRYSPTGTTSSVSDFVYWTDKVSSTSTVPVLVNELGLNAPAPWAVFTKAGCDVAYAGIADAVLENTGADIDTVFGANSPQAAEAEANSALASTDYVGVAIHCAKNSKLCATPLAAPDLLPDEPGGYKNFSALFGHKNVAPQISKSLPLLDLTGAVIADSKGNPGFPGFDGLVPSVSLAYGAAYLEAGIPVVNIYASDAHDGHQNLSGPLAPGSLNDRAQLLEYDAAFASFFARLKQDGIDETNTLFVITTDESDHFVGSAPTPANCDGISITCDYAMIGEVDADLSRLVATQRGNTTPFKVHSDSAPIIYITGNPAQDSATTRQLEQDLMAVTVADPITGQTVPLGQSVIDQTGMGFLHMLSVDTLRNPSFNFYQNDDFFGFASGQTTSCASGTACVELDGGFAYNHGDFQKDIRTTWLGIVGPGVPKIGQTDAVWSDHTDVKPTILALAGFTDNYVHDGRVLFEFLTNKSLPKAVAADRDGLIALAAAYKEITAPFQELGLMTLQSSTKALTGLPAAFEASEERLTGLTQSRDVLADRIKRVLDKAEFKGVVHPEEIATLTQEAQLFRNFARQELQN
ncbi:MAG TPA: hypothetical protein VM689_18825 [Aliidongia sp.]|nr:hypothetical protein [Aliidongia sp.]